MRSGVSSGTKGASGISRKSLFQGAGGQKGAKHGKAIALRGGGGADGTKQQSRLALLKGGEIIKQQASLRCLRST